MKTTMNVKDAFLKWHDRDWTPEEKTFSKKLEEYADEKHSAGFLGGWNAALASVVEEPVLTETQIRNITLHTLDLLDWANNMPTQGNAADFITKALLAAGRIPASNPTPQQEGGLTRAWFDDQIADLSMNDPTRRNAKERLWIRITRALEAKEAEVREEFAEWYNPKGSEWEFVTPDQMWEDMQTIRTLIDHDGTNSPVDAIKTLLETLRTELAEAKKGRYAIGETAEARGFGRSGYVQGFIAFLPDGATVRPGLATNPADVRKKLEPEPIPTVEAMMEAIVEKYYVDHQGELPAKGHDALLADAWAYTAREREKVESMESLWRRDCKGGV